VEQAWQRAAQEVPSFGVHAKLDQLHSSLHAWDHDFLKKPKHLIRTAQRKLERAMAGPLTTENDLIAKEQAKLIELLLEQEEVHWMQRSQTNWLQNGDHNTSFFHQFASARRKRTILRS
jgi:hypothetical protein